MQRVLVTGAAGFLGSHLVDRLLGEGHHVIGLDNFITGGPQNLRDAIEHPNFELWRRDVREPFTANIDLVFNLACPASPVQYKKNPYATLTTSVLGALRMLEVATASAVRVIHASTSEVYGDPACHPQTEDYWGNVNPIGHRACYDEGKRAAETLLSDANRLLGLDIRIVRIFNTYGPRMAIDDGRVVSSFIVSHLRSEAMNVHGNGSQTRSFCYVSDMVEGLMLAAQVERFDSPMNLGNPQELSVCELAKKIGRIGGGEARIVFTDRPSDDPSRRCPDITKATKALGFVPKVSIDDGLRRTVESFRARLCVEQQLA